MYILSCLSLRGNILSGKGVQDTTFAERRLFFPRISNAEIEFEVVIQLRVAANNFHNHVEMEKELFRPEREEGEKVSRNQPSRDIRAYQKGKQRALLTQFMESVCVFLSGIYLLHYAGNGAGAGACQQRTVKRVIYDRRYFYHLYVYSAIKVTLGEISLGKLMRAWKFVSLLRC